MAKPTRASPKPGRTPGSNGPNADDTLFALAQEIIDKEQIAAATDRRKSNRLLYEGKGGSLAHLDTLYKMRDEPASAVTAFFTGLYTTMSAFFTDLTQVDLFTPKTSKSEAAGFQHAGMMAALKGDDPVPPPGLNTAEANDYETGYDKGFKARAAAQKRLADTLAQAIANAEAGLVTDGKTGAAIDPNKKRPTRAEAKATAVGAQAAADFQKDNPEVKIPGAEGGAQAAADGFEAPESEIAGQTTRKAVVGAKEGDDPLVVDGVRHPNQTRADEARKLAAAGGKIGQSDKAAAKRAEAGI